MSANMGQTDKIIEKDYAGGKLYIKSNPETENGKEEDPVPEKELVKYTNEIDFSNAKIGDTVYMLNGDLPATLFFFTGTITHIRDGSITAQFPINENEMNLISFDFNGVEYGCNRRVIFWEPFDIPRRKIRKVKIEVIAYAIYNTRTKNIRAAFDTSEAAVNHQLVYNNENELRIVELTGSIEVEE